MSEKEDGRYKKASQVVNEWLELHTGEAFNLDMICRQLNVSDRESRKLVAIKLAYEVEHRKLEKLNSPHLPSLYRAIDNTLKIIDWVNASDLDVLNLTWPYGREDDSHFGFDGKVTISPGDVIVIAGVSNMGKTCFCLNMLWENMDKYPCFLMGNEYTPAKFKRRVKRMTWANPLKEDGSPKFDLVDRREGWKDIIKPDYINIIDWIDLGDNFYQIGKVIEGIQGKLKNGIAVIALQKAPGKGLGLGGSFSLALCTLYLTIDFERLTVVKAKEWNSSNPNNTMYAFRIVDGGTKFHDIRRVKPCYSCRGSGAGKEGKCPTCLGTGYTEVPEAEE